MSSLTQPPARPLLDKEGFGRSHGPQARLVPGTQGAQPGPSFG